MSTIPRWECGETKVQAQDDFERMTMTDPIAEAKAKMEAAIVERDAKLNAAVAAETEWHNAANDYREAMTAYMRLLEDRNDG